MKHMTRWLLLALLLAGCAAPPPPPPSPAPPVAVTVDDTAPGWYATAAAAGKKIYKIDAAQSLVTVTVRRGGPMARFGHDHVIASRTLAGYVAPDAGRADFQFRLDQMTVDEAALRTAAGLDTQPSADAIQGTRDNMLGRVLEAERYPLVLLQAELLPNRGDTLKLTVTLHGVARWYEVPTKIERSKTSLTATGELRMLQTDFGIKPMSVMAGALTVQDQMELAFRIVAAPLK